MSRQTSKQDRALEASSDEDLMKRVALDDPAAFRVLFNRYHRVLSRLMLRRGADRFETRDLVQQTFLQLHRARNDYRPEAPLRPYLVTIALNVHRAELRRRSRHPEEALHVEPHEPSVEAGAVAAIERRQEAAMVRRALARLPGPQREVIELHWFQELPFREIAEVVGANLSAVKVRAFRGYQRLRRLLENRGTP